MQDFEQEARDIALLSRSAQRKSSGVLDAAMLADLEEIKSIVLEHNVWVVEELPPGTNLLTPKWVRKVKQSGKHKSRLCVRGFKQIHGLDYKNSYISCYTHFNCLAEFIHR